MSITKRVLDNRHAVWASVIAAFVFGTLAYMGIPVRLFPDTAPPLVNVVTPWPGAAASDVAQDLSRILEEEFASIEGVVQLKASSQDNLSLISIEFQYGTDVALGAIDVQNAVSRVGQELPAGAELPRVMTFSTADRPVYTVGIAGLDLTEARRLAEDVVRPRLQQVSGVAAVDVFGGHTQGITVALDPALAETHRLPLPAVSQAILTANLSAPAGRLRGTRTETAMRVDQRSHRVDSLEALKIPLPDGTQLRLGDVATVTRGGQDDDAWFAIQGQQAIAVQVFRTTDANTVAVVAAVQAEVAQLAQAYPEMQFLAGEESASFTEQSVANLLENVWQALLLASVLLFLFLGRFRTALVTIFTMPLSYGITFGLMHWMGMEFNMVTLSAVILAVGMVVDASVVVLENIIRLRDDEGLNPRDAAILGADQVRLPVLAGVATTLVVLIPLLSLRGFIGQVFNPLASTLLMAFLSSVAVALVVVPVLSLYAKDGGWVDAISKPIAAPFQYGMDRLRAFYLSLLTFGLRHPAVVLLLAVGSFGAGVGGLLSAGMDVLPRMDSGAFSIALETPSGTSLAETARVVRSVEALLSEEADVTLVQAQAGYEAGMHFSGGGGVMGPTQGYLSVTLSPRTDRETTIWEIEDRVRAGLETLPDISHAVVKEVGNTAKPTTLAPVVVTLSGPDPRVLDVLGEQVAARLSKVEGIVAPTRTWRRDLSRILIRVDQPQALAHGSNTAALAKLLVTGTEGIPAGSMTFAQGAPEPIRVRYQRSLDPTVEELLSWPLFISDSGQVVPIRSVAHAEKVVEQGLITRKNLQQVLQVHAEVRDRPLSFVAADAQDALASLVLPQGYEVKLEGENSDLIDSRQEILRAFAISILAVYLLLVAQFRSFTHPLTVMMAVPLSISGVAGALWLAQKPVSMPVMVGLILLVGTVVNNAIILVDIIRTQREAGVARHAAILEGVRTRFRPIMMTSLSTVVGMIPLALEWALGAERFSPLATAVIGGLLASTLLTLLVIPVLYDLMDRLTERLRRPSAAATAVLLLGVGMVVAMGTPKTSWAQAPTQQAGTTQVVAAMRMPETSWAQAPTQQAGTTQGVVAGQGAGSRLARESAEGQRVGSRLSLDQAWALTTRSHPGFTAAEARVDAMVAQKKAARRQLLPSATVQTRYTRLSYVEDFSIELPSGATQFIGESVEDAYSFRVSAQQPLFSGGALLFGTQAAEARLEQSMAEREVARGGLWETFVAAWYGLTLAEETVSIQQVALDVAQAQEARMKRLQQQGRATDVQVANVSLKRVEAQQALSTARGNLELAAFRVDVLLGQHVERDRTDLLTLAAQVDPVVGSDDGASPDLGGSPRPRAAQAGRKAAEARARAARGKRAPRIALRLGYQYENPNNRYFPVVAEWNDSWDASVVLSWDFTAGVSHQQARAAAAEARGAKAAADSILIETQLAYAQAALAVRRGQEALTLAGERVRVAARSAEAAEAALEAGRVTVVELLTAEAEEARARAIEQRVAFDLVMAAQKLNTLRGKYGPGIRQVSSSLGFSGGRGPLQGDGW